MNWQELIKTLIEVVLIPLLGVLTTFLVKYLKTKADELANKAENELEAKYIKMLTDTITSCVISTNQTYVDNLKAAGTFDKESQKRAFQETYQNVMNILSEDCVNYLEMAFGDLEVYIRNKIEAEVKNNKDLLPLPIIEE